MSTSSHVQDDRMSGLEDRVAHLEEVLSGVLDALRDLIGPDVQARPRPTLRLIKGTG